MKAGHHELGWNLNTTTIIALTIFLTRHSMGTPFLSPGTLYYITSHFIRQSLPFLRNFSVVISFIPARWFSTLVSWMLSVPHINIFAFLIFHILNISFISFFKIVNHISFPLHSHPLILLHLTLKILLSYSASF